MTVSKVWITGCEVYEARLVPDPYAPGGYREDWTQPPIRIFRIPWASFQPETTREIRDGADRVIVVTGFKLITRPPFVNRRLASKHRIKVPGYTDLFLIKGDPMFWDGMRPHMEVDLETIYG